MPVAQQQPIPFRYGTRKRFAAVPVQAGGTITAGGRFSTVLPRVGYLSKILLRVDATINLADVGALNLFMPFNLIQRMQVAMNVGSAVLYDTTGYENYIVQRTRRGHRDPATDASLYAAPVAKGDNTWALTYEIPIAGGFGDNFDRGLINLQSGETDVTISGSYATAAELTTNPNTMTGTLSIGYEYFELPVDGRVAHPITMLHRIMSSQHVFPATGDQTITIPREGILRKLIHVCSNNDALADTFDNFRLVFNKTDIVVNRRRWEQKMEQNFLYAGDSAIALPVGIYVHEFEASRGAGAPGWGDNRDLISSESLATLESVITAPVPAGTVHRIDTIREFDQYLAA